MVADVTDLERKATCVGECIQCFAARIPAGSPVIVTLIQISAGLLAGSKRNSELFSVFFDGNHFRQRLTDEFLLEFESLQLTHPAIIPKENGHRLISFIENVGDQGLHRIGCLDKALNNKPVVVPIYNEARQKVSFGKYAPAE